MSENFVGTVASADNELQGVIENSELNINVEILAAGEKGDTGKSLEYSWNGTRLGVRQEGEINYTYVDLKGQKGDTGLPGLDGKSLEFSWNGTQLGIRVQGQSAYQYVDLKGAKGDTGATGKNLEFVWNGTQLGVRVEGEAQYQYVDLKGEKGDKGDTGNGISSIVRTSGTGAAGTTDTYTITFTNDTTTTFEVYNGADGLGAGDMIKSVYDTNNDGIVDDAEKLGGQLPEYYAKQADVTALQEDVSVNLMTAQMELSNTDSIKSVTANVGSVPKVKIVAPDMLVNLLGKDGDFEVDSNGDGLADGWIQGAYVSSKSLDSANALFGRYSQKLNINTLSSSSIAGVAKEFSGITNGNKVYISTNIKKNDYSKFGALSIYRYAKGGWTNGEAIKDVVVLNNNFNKISSILNWDVTRERIYVGTRGNNTNTVDDYINIDGVMLVDLTAIFGAGKEPDLAWCDANIRYVNGVQPLLNPCLTVRGKNLVRNGNCEGGLNYWVPNSRVNFSISQGKFSFAANAAPYWGEVQQKVKVKPNTDYYLSFNRGGTASTSDAQISVFTADGSINLRTGSGSFNSGNNSFVAVIMVTRTATPTIADSIYLIEGATPDSYEPYREKRRIYPVELGKVSTYADELEDDGIEVVKTWRVKKYVLQASDVTSITSGTTVEFATVSTANLIRKKPITTHLVDGSFIVNGWAETTGTTIAWDNEEHKWKYGKSNVTQALQFFVPKGAYANLAAAQVALAGTEIWYVLAQEEQEIIEPIGSLRLEQGYNCIDISTGIVLEKANPKFNGATEYLINHTTFGSALKHKTNNILEIFKNGVIDTANWTLYKNYVGSAYSHGGALAVCQQNKYDPAAYYAVKYEVLHEDYDSQQVSVIMEYADNLRTSHNQLVENVAGLESEVNDVWFSLLPIADKEIGMKMISLLTTETTTDLKNKINEILNVWR